MVNKLFVYGTLAPGQSNEHLLRNVDGTWANGEVVGVLYPQGLGPTIGYPAVNLNSSGTAIEGLVFSSSELSAHWKKLDDFEGEGYRRVVTTVKLRNGKKVKAYIYALNAT